MFRTKVVEAFLHVTCPTLNVKKSTKKVGKKVLVPPLMHVVENVTIMLLKGYINVAQVPQICALGEDLGGRATLTAVSASNSAKVPKPAELLPARARRTRKSRVVEPPSPAVMSTLKSGQTPSKLPRRR